MSNQRIDLDDMVARAMGMVDQEGLEEVKKQHEIVAARQQSERSTSGRHGRTP